MRARGSALDLQQHLRVVGELLEEEEEAFHGLDRAMAGQSAADQVDLVEDVLGQEIFDETEFNRRIERIEVPEPHRLNFIFYNGDKIECEWAHRSRTESWTDEMKQTAREKDQKRRQELPCQQ